MRVLLVSPSRIVRDCFISELIPRGIVLSWCENVSDALSEMREKKTTFDVMVLESVSKYDTINFLSMFGGLEVRPIIVLYTEIHSHEELYDYLKLGVGGFLQKPLNPKNIFPVITRAYENFKGAPPERKVVRVQLEEGEGIVEFTSKSGIRVIGNIIDLSVGGLAFSFAPKYANAFEEGEEIHYLKLILRSDETSLRGRVKAKDNERRVGVVIFTELNVDAVQKISRFIFFKTSA
ncbi:MAG: PilZ domain-containing protein [Brevinematia bacterium]